MDMFLNLNNSSNESIKFDRRADGIYLILDKALSSKPIEFGDVMSAIERNGISGCDSSAVAHAIVSKEKVVSVKITSNVDVKPIDEKIVINVSSNKMTATISFIPPQNGGKLVSFNDVIDELNSKNITYGIDHDSLRKIVNDKLYNQTYVIAKGLDPVNGIDGKLIFHFNTEKKTLKPKIIDGGKVDYRDLGLIELAKAGQKLVTVILPVEGSFGRNIYGNDVSFVKGKQFKMPAGKNVYFSHDSLEMFAEIDGQIVYANNKISVNPVYEVQGDVDNSTGNIHFLGTVIVKGNILTGFSVIANGSIEIFGVVEGATVHSEEDIIIHSGVQGHGQCKLIASGSIKAKYIENSNLTAGSDIVADAIMHSNIRCGKNLIVEGKKGLLVGGSFRVGGEIHSKVIGSSMATSTIIEVGFELNTYDKYNNLKKELSTLRNELSSVDTLIESLMKLKQANQLSDSKKTFLIKAIRSKSFILDKISSLQKQIEALLPVLQRNKGFIKVQSVIHPGAKITIGNAVMYVREEIKYCTLYNEAAEIKIGSFA